MDNNILTVAIDAIRGNISEYSKGEQSVSLRNAFIELNGGSEKINPKTFRPGNALFDLVQEIIPVMIDEGFKTNENPLFNLVDYRNIAYGDENQFTTEAPANFYVATTAGGIQDVRRQRLVGGQSIKVDTEVKIIRVYENLGRLLAGRVDFNKFVEGVASSFEKYMAEMAYGVINAMSSSTPGLSATYVTSGTYDEATLLGIVEHVEAATGKTAVIIGTKSALRKINTTFTAPSALEDKYALGYYGKFNGTDCIALKQVHKAGTDTFVMSQNKIFVVASDDKPIKLVNEGEGLLVPHDATRNADLTQEYVYAQAMGCGAICAAPMGIYTIS